MGKVRQQNCLRASSPRSSCAWPAPIPSYPSPDRAHPAPVPIRVLLLPSWLASHMENAGSNGGWSLALWPTSVARTSWLPPASTTAW